MNYENKYKMCNKKFVKIHEPFADIEKNVFGYFVAVVRDSKYGYPLAEAGNTPDEAWAKAAKHIENHKKNIEK